LQHSAKSILVVDDNVAVRSEISEWLRHAGHQVTLAKDGPSALAALRDTPTEVALIDVQLPQIMGTQVVQTIRQEWPEIRCILMSGAHGLAEDNDELVLLHGEGVPILCKPFRPEELLEQLLGATTSEQAITASSSRAEARQRTPQNRSQLANVVRQLWSATRVSLVVLFELDPDQRVVRIVEQCGRPVFQAAALPTLIHSPVRVATEDGLLVRVADADEAAKPPFRYLAAHIRFASCLGVPVVVTLPNRYALFLFSERPELATNPSVETFASASAIAAAAWLERDAFAQQAAELQRLVLLGQLGRTLAHEINNQVQNIPWAAKKLPDFVDQLNRQAEANPARAREILAEASQLLCEVSLEVDRLASIARPFTSLAQLDHQSSLLLDTTVEEAVSVVLATAQRVNVTLTIENSVSLAFMRGQDTALHQILVNVLLNALQQIESTRGRVGGRVVVRLTAGKSDGQPVYRIAIEDDGPGIHRRLWDRIFEMGYTTRPGGSGVGLSVARRLIEGMAGRIFVAESWLGWGSTFVIELPR
jgi:signal transduction histidine kinase